MDDVARACGISKKTLYQHFENKDELIIAAIHMHQEQDKEEFGKIKSDAANALEELFNISLCLREHIAQVNPSLIYDLQKYHPGPWEEFQKFKKKFVLAQVASNLEQGIKEGYYRQDIDPEILAILRVESVYMAFNDQVFPAKKFDMVKVQMQVFGHFVQGILSESGRQLYQRYENQFDPNHN